MEAPGDGLLVHLGYIMFDLIGPEKHNLGSDQLRFIYLISVINKY